MWRAHVENINSLDFIDEYKLLITASSDCSVRLWNKDGDYIGEFILIIENGTEFNFIYHLKRLSKPSIMVLLPQILDRCRE